MSSTLNAIRTVNLVLTGLGAAVFAARFLFVTLAPEDFDRRTRDFAIAKVKVKVDDRIGTAVRSKAADKASALAGVFSKRLEERIQKLRADLDAGVPEFIADILAEACKLDCERRAKAAKAIRSFYKSTIAAYGITLKNMRTFIETQYDRVMEKLRADLKIFSGSSFIALLFALLLSVFRGKAAAHLLPFSIALTVATVIAVYWYVFGQDWVMTMIFSSYWG